MAAESEQEISGRSQFHGRLRVRANGILMRDDKILLVKINSPTTEQPFWMPPGGGVDYGEHLRKAVEREMLEETGLTVKAEELVLVSEYLKKPWHAVEFYFICTEENRLKAVLGDDPELLKEHQMLEDIAWFTIDELQNIEFKPDELPKIAEQLSQGAINEAGFPWYND